MRGFGSVVTLSYNVGSGRGALGIYAPHLSLICLNFIIFWEKCPKQESIPVGCTPPAFLVLVEGGVCPTHLDADPLDTDPLEADLPLEADPLDTGPPLQNPCR